MFLDKALYSRHTQVATSEETEKEAISAAQQNSGCNVIARLVVVYTYSWFTVMTCGSLTVKSTPAE